MKEDYNKVKIGDQIDLSLLTIDDIGYSADYTDEEILYYITNSYHNSNDAWIVEIFKNYYNVVVAAYDGNPGVRAFMFEMIGGKFSIYERTDVKDLEGERKGEWIYYEGFKSKLSETKDTVIIDSLIYPGSDIEEIPRDLFYKNALNLSAKKPVGK